MSMEFLNGISFEENPFEDETPDNVVVYTLDGRESESHEE